MIRTLKAALVGVLIWSGFAPLEFWPGPILGLSILFSSLIDRKLTDRLIISLIAGLSSFLPMLHWSSTYVGALPWLILAIGQSIFFMLIGLLPMKKNLAGVFSFAGAFVLIELLRMKAPFGGFGWGRVGFTQVDPLSHLYPFLGVTGVSLLISFFAAAAIWRRKSIVVFLVLILTSFVPTANAQKSSDSFKIIAVQGGVDELGFDFNDNPMRVLERHIQATPTNLNADLIIWPENSIDVDPAKYKAAAQKLSEYFADSEVPLLAGVVEQSPLGPKNSSLLYTANGDVALRYVKQDLAPFGEYMPVRKLAESISSYAKQVNDFVPGTRFQNVELNNWKMQSFICFEILDDDHVKKGAQGMDFLIAQTNNATFGNSSQAAQQLQITRARAAELKKEFSVVSTTGFTAHLSNTGEILEELNQFESSSLEMNMERSVGQSWAAQLSTTQWAILALLMLVLNVLPRYRYSR